MHRPPTVASRPPAPDRPLCFARRFATTIALAFALHLSPATPAGAEYRLGEGLPLFDGRVVLGGYANVTFGALDDSPDQLALEDLSTFVTIHLDEHWSVFTEAELEDTLQFDGDGVDSGNDLFSLERLYLQWEATDNVRVRVGEVLTPIGIWNVIHAAPLVWTTSRPITTERFFDTGLTGAEARFLASPGDFEVATTLFAQVTGHIDDTDDAQRFRRAFGGRIQAEKIPGARVGLSFVRYDDGSDHRWENTVAADFLWDARFLELSAETAVNDPEGGATTWGAYGQGVLHMTPQVHPFLRVEFVDFGSRERVPVVFGVAWKPKPAMVIKLEGIVGGDDTELGGDGVLTSFSVLF